MHILDNVLSEPLFILLAIWSLYWKGRALWRAAKKGEQRWFVALLLVNTLGILEILYLRMWGKEKNDIVSRV